MAWTDPKTWTAEPLTSSDLNTHLRDNLNELKDPPSDNYELDEGADYTTTSTSFTDVDATNLSFTLDTNGGDVMVHFHGTAFDSGGYVHLNLLVDGVAHAAQDGITQSGNAVFSQIAFTRLITGLSAGSHTIKLQWKVSAGTGNLYAGAGSAGRDSHPQMWVREVS